MREGGSNSGREQQQRRVLRSRLRPLVRTEQLQQPDQLAPCQWPTQGQWMSARSMGDPPSLGTACCKIISRVAL